jgi:thiol-disulfide isomerase/thioredoxin
LHRAFLASFLLLLLLSAQAAHARDALPARVGDKAPAFRLPGRSGEVASDSLAGKLVYVDFWASWCEPCRRSFPWLRGLSEHYAGRGLVVVAIDLDKERAAADKFLARFPAPFAIAFDPAGRAAEAFGVDAMPSSILVGRDGQVLERHAGFDPKRAAEIEERIKKELAP